MTPATLSVPLGRQGPGRLPPEIVARLEHRLRRKSAGLLPGDHLTPGAGDGMELAQLRPYEPGDDPRRLDPAASARTGVPHVRLQVPERTVTTWLVLDVSASMAFGTQGRLKSDVGEGVAEVVGRVGVRRGGRVALVVAGGEEPRLLPPRPGRGALAALRAFVREGVMADAAPPARGRRERSERASVARNDAMSSTSHHAQRSPLAEALVRVTRVARSTGVVVVVSDFRDPGWSAALRSVAARHTVLAVEVTDPAEAELPVAGLLTLVDPESGRLVEADTNAGGLRRAYAEAEAERRAEVASGIRRAGADHLVLDTQTDWLRDLGRRMS
jgi:uncharacterized protein (DUF58 family)